MRNLKKSIAVILIFCITCFAAVSAENYIVCESKVFTEFTVTLGDTQYLANVNTIRKTVTVEALAIKTGKRALTKAKIDYSGAVIDEIPSGSRIDLTNPVSCTVKGEQWTINVELSTVQRAVNFNNAGLMAANHANFYRRNAIAYQASSVGGRNYGYWMNLGYAFDADGNSVEKDTYGSITVKNKEMMNLTKTKAGEPFGVVSTAGDNGTAASTDKIVSEFKIRLNSYKKNNKTLVKMRSGNVDWMTLSCTDGAEGEYYIGWQSASSEENNIVTDKKLKTGEWYTLRMIFRKYPASETGYNVEIYVNNEFICESNGKVTDSQGNTVKPEGCIKNGGKDTDFAKAQLYILADKDAEFDMDIDDVYITALIGNESPFDDSEIEYEFEKEQPPVVPDDPEKPSITEFNGVLDKGFENNGEGWNINPYNIIPNSSFETDDIWRIGSSDKAEVVYTDEKAYTGLRSAKMEYLAAGGLGAYRNYNIYEINPFSTYALGMSVITSNIEDGGLNAQLSFKTSSSNTSFDSNKITDENGGYCKVTENYSDWHTVYDEFTPSKNNEKYVTQLAFRMNGKTGSAAYFDDLYYGTIERMEKFGETYKNYTVKHSDVNSGKGMLKLGAYNNLHGADEISSIPLEIEDLKTYRVSAYAKSLSDSAYTRIKITYLNKDKNEIYSKITDKICTKEWEKIESEFTAPETAETMIISLIADGSGLVCFDDVDYTVMESVPSDFGGLSDKKLSIPQTGAKIFEFNPYVADQYGSKIRGLDVSLSIKNPTEGIEISNSGITVSSAVIPGSSVIITAESGNLKKEYTITFSKMYMSLNGADAITRKNSAVTSSYTAYISENGADAEKLDNDKVIWSINSKNSEVSINKEGTVTVNADALLGKYIIKAVYIDDNTVTCEKELEIIKSVSGGIGGGGSSGGSKNSGGTGGYAAAVAVPAAQPQKSPVVFEDINSEHWAYEDVMEFYNDGFIEGKAEGIFDPDGNITRAEFVKIIVKALELEAEMPKADFSDVSKDSWAYEYIATAVALEIINGYGNNEFKPDDKITRQDIAVITYKAAKNLGIGLWFRQEINFADAPSISDYAEKPVTVLSEAGIINGMENNLFAPNETATRAQAVAILQRIRMLMK